MIFVEIDRFKNLKTDDSIFLRSVQTCKFKKGHEEKKEEKQVFSLCLKIPQRK